MSTPGSPLPTNPLVQVGQRGQGRWYDCITRDLVESGERKRLITERGLCGMTSNPTIFEKAIAGSDLYDADIRRLSAEGRNPAEIFESLAVADVQAACDVFRPLYDATGGTDGLVSLEVSPTLANDTSGTVAEAERLWRTVARPNVMIKIPGTIAGLPAISRCITNGINVNVTLLFSVERHAEVMAAYIEGLERRITCGQAVDHVASVASFFVSRVDTRSDPMLDQLGREGQGRRSTAAIPNACAAYAPCERAVSYERRRGPRRPGARVHPAPGGGPGDGERRRGGGQRGRDDAVRPFRDGPDDDRGRRLRNSGDRREERRMNSQLIILAVVIIFAVVGYFIWDRRYRGGKEGLFKATDEIFKDPTTGKMTRVYEDPETGARQYREEG